MKVLRKALVEGSFLLDLEAHDLDAIFSQTLDLVAARGKLPPDKCGEVHAALLQREEQVSTAIGHGVAIPHAYLDLIKQPVIVFVRLAHPVNLGAPDGIPTRFLFVLLGPPNVAAEHLDTLTNIARLMSDEEFRYDAGEARSQLALLDALDQFNARTAAPPSPQQRGISEALRYTGRLCGGMMDDIRRRLPHYASDFRDGMHSKCVASTLFLYFACLAPAVTFGGIMAEYTGSHIGAVEMLVATAVCGVFYALVSGQPLVILGGTGPMLIFTRILYELCVDLEIPFLESYAWVGLWSMLFVVIMATTDASCLMRYFTRFTDETFAALISIIFIFAAIEALADIVMDAYQKETRSHDEALIPLLLAIGTFYIAMSLSRFRRSRYLLPQIREFLADFGPTIALAATTLVAVWLHSLQEIELNELPAPESFRPTYETEAGTARRWLVNPFDAPRWVWIAAAGPALLAAVLIYMDQNITARLVNSPDHRLEKGETYHLDLGLVGLLVGVCSLFGLPWLVAATVRSLNHVRSLATVEEVTVPGGETHERIIHVRENRVSSLFIHVLIGLSLLLLPALTVIPMAVLYGLFLFMGVVSMAGNQFFERINLWPMDPALYPTTHYIRKVPLRVIHRFTLLQLVCLGVLGLVEVTRMRIIFPLLVALLVPVRIIAGRFFKPEHLEALDAEEEPEEEETHWV